MPDLTKALAVKLLAYNLYERCKTRLLRTGSFRLYHRQISQTLERVSQPNPLETNEISYSSVRMSAPKM